MSITDFAADFARGFDESRKILLGPNAKLVLLKQDGKDKAFTELQVITAGWYSEYSKFFGNTTFNLADLTAATAANIQKAAFVSMRDTTLLASNNVIYEMKGETAPPDSNVPWWRIRAIPTSRKFIPPATQEI